MKIIWTLIFCRYFCFMEIYWNEKFSLEIHAHTRAKHILSIKLVLLCWICGSIDAFHIVKTITLKLQCFAHLLCAVPKGPHFIYVFIFIFVPVIALLVHRRLSLHCRIIKCRNFQLPQHLLFYATVLRMWKDSSERADIVLGWPFTSNGNVLDSDINKFKFISNWLWLPLSFLLEFFIDWENYAI